MILLLPNDCNRNRNCNRLFKKYCSITIVINNLMGNRNRKYNWHGNRNRAAVIFNAVVRDRAVFTMKCTVWK